MKRASIDIGSNTAILLIVEVEAGIVREIIDQSQIVSLGENLDRQRMFTDASMERTFRALSAFREEIVAQGIELSSVIVTATEASRVAKNATSFFQRVKDELGLKTLILSAEGEAYYTALGVASDRDVFKSSDYTIMDIGGASTELIQVQSQPFLVKKSISLPVGSVRATDWLRGGVYELRAKEVLNIGLIGNFKCRELIAVAGTMVTLCMAIEKLNIFNSSVLNAAVLVPSQLEALGRELEKLNEEEIRYQYPMVGKRSSTIAAGCKLAIDIIKSLSVERIRISTRGLRYGTALSGRVEQRFLH